MGRGSGGSSGGLRGMKAQGFEGGIRVPLLARRPGTIPPGRVCDAPAAIIYLFPTVMKAVGVSIPKDLTIDGRHLSPLLLLLRTSRARTTVYVYE